MKHFSTEQVRQILLSTIHSLSDCPEKFLTDPRTNFTRTKKISFEQTMLFPMLAGPDNISTELLDFFGEDALPLPSAMIQRRNQIRPEAFITLFSRFLQKIPIQNTFHGYQLVACDGSRLNLPYNPSDPDTFIQCIKDRRGINHTQLQKICIRFLKGIIKELDVLIKRFLVPVRPGRSFERNLRRQSADTLAYR